MDFRARNTTMTNKACDKLKMAGEEVEGKGQGEEEREGVD